MKELAVLLRISYQLSSLVKNLKLPSLDPQHILRLQDLYSRSS